MITRFSVLPDERRVILGIDNSNIFEAGVVYEAVKIIDEIILRPIGTYALAKTGMPSECSTIHDIVYYGMHLIIEKEFDSLDRNLK